MLIESHYSLRFVYKQCSTNTAVYFLKQKLRMNNFLLIGIGLLVIVGIFFLVTGSPDDSAVTQQDTNTPNTVPDPSDTGAMASPASEDEAMSSNSIVGVAANTDVVSTLVTAVTAADLVTTLQSGGPFTVFAPVNEAFAALPAGTVETLLQPENQADLQAVLTYHVVPGNVMAADLSDGMTVTTVQGEELTIGVQDGTVTINGNATVVAADVEASNGVIHLIDAVLLPPSQ